MEKPTPATIRDVAARAGVALSTVSHVLNQTRPVSEVLRERVLVAMRELDYRPNNLARSLRRNRSLTVGMVVPDCSNPFFAEMARGVEDGCFDLGYTVTICNSDESIAKERVYVESLIERQIDGVIMVVARTDSDNVDLLVDQRIPTVVIDRDYLGLMLDAVLIDNYHGGYLAGQHLVAMGYRFPACIAGPFYSIPVQDRVRGFRAALDDAGLGRANALVEATTFQFQSGGEAFDRLVAQFPDVDAVFACNDRLAVGALRRAVDRGYGVPDDLGVVGFDNIDLAAFTTPSLTTIAQPTYKMGREGARLLVRRMIGEVDPPIALKLDVQLTIRDSTRRSVHSTL